MVTRFDLWIGGRVSDYEDAFVREKCAAPTALGFILQLTHTSGFAYARLQCGLTCGRASGARIFEFLRPSHPPDHRETPILKRSPSCFRLSKTIFLAITPDASGSVPLDLYFMPLSISAGHAPGHDFYILVLPTCFARRYLHRLFQR